ncbi:MAG: gliding motility lipoprotein GldB, partial [Bacteroidia bacterium]
IVVDSFRGWAQSEYELDQIKRDLLSQMVYNGKILYFIEAMRPREDKHKVIGYTKEQYEWCNNNEGNIWSFFVSQNLLYSSDQIKISKFINEGPGTGGFPPEAPAMLGNYIGWQIVRALKEKNKNISLAELMEIDDAQQILNLSAYKPKK